MSDSLFMCTTYKRTQFQSTADECTWFVSDFLKDAQYSLAVWILIIALVIYNAHIINFHMDPTGFGGPGSELLHVPQLPDS